MSARRRITRSQAYARARANATLDSLAWSEERDRWNRTLAGLCERMIDMGAQPALTEHIMDAGKRLAAQALPGLDDYDDVEDHGTSST